MGVGGWVGVGGRVGAGGWVSVGGGWVLGVGGWVGVVVFIAHICGQHPRRRSHLPACLARGIKLMAGSAPQLRRSTRIRRTHVERMARPQNPLCSAAGAEVGSKNKEEGPAMGAQLQTQIQDRSLPQFAQSNGHAAPHSEAQHSSSGFGNSSLDAAVSQALPNSTTPMQRDTSESLDPGDPSLDTLMELL